MTFSFLQTKYVLFTRLSALTCRVNKYSDTLTYLSSVKQPNFSFENFRKVFCKQHSGCYIDAENESREILRCLPLKISLSN